MISQQREPAPRTKRKRDRQYITEDTPAVFQLLIGAPELIASQQGRHVKNSVKAESLAASGLTLEREFASRGGTGKPQAMFVFQHLAVHSANRHIFRVLGHELWIQAGFEEPPAAKGKSAVSYIAIV